MGTHWIGAKIYTADLSQAASVLKDQRVYISHAFSYIIRILQTKRREISSGVRCNQLLLFDVSVVLCFPALLHILIHVSGSAYIPYINSVNTAQHFTSPPQMTRIVLKQTQMNK